MSLFKVLMISWLLGAGLSFFKDVNIDYQIKCVSMSFLYLLSACYCYKYVNIELQQDRVLNSIFISLLCVCMVISCWFNFIFASRDIYYLLVDIRYYNSFSWRTIYNSVELLSLFIVGRNAIISLYQWIDCRRRRLRVIIKNNSAFNIGR